MWHAHSTRRPYTSQGVKKNFDCPQSNIVGVGSGDIISVLMWARWLMDASLGSRSANRCGRGQGRSDVPFSHLGHVLLGSVTVYLFVFAKEQRWWLVRGCSVRGEFGKDEEKLE